MQKSQRKQETERPTRGRKMRKGVGWRLLASNGQQVFAATLVQTINIGGQRIAIFSVPKR
jgi:hypothetical protein